MPRSALVAVSALGLLLGAARLSAQTNLVTNGSFETGTLYRWTSIAGTANTTIINPGLPSNGSDGLYFINFGSGVGSGGSITQMIDTIAGTSYTFSFDARYLGSASSASTLSYSASSYPSYSPHLSGTLTAGTELTANGSRAGSYTTDWNHFSYTFTANSAGTLIKFQDMTLSGAGASTDLQLDNISVVAVSAVPEPSTYAAFAGLGALGFVAWRRRRTTAHST